MISSRWKNMANVYSPPEPYTRGGRVPSLVWFCLQCISDFPDQVQLPCKLTYRPAIHRPPKNFRLVDRLLTSALTRRHENPDVDMDDKFNLSRLDPRLWVVTVQIFDHIPSELRTYTIPLNDELLPLLQCVPNTATFSLLTILELPGCLALTDNSITDVKGLHTLVAFDASRTAISARGILALARTLQANDSSEVTRKLRGPWALRILRVKHCARIDDGIYSSLSLFPLLSVVDLRGTKCNPRNTNDEFTFSPSINRSLFSSDLALSLEALQAYDEGVQMHSAPKEYQFILRIKTLCHSTVANALSEAETRIQSHLSPSPGQTSRNRHRNEEHQGKHAHSDTWEDALDLHSGDSEICWNSRNSLSYYAADHESNKDKNNREETDEKEDEFQESEERSLIGGREGDYDPTARRTTMFSQSRDNDYQDGFTSQLSPQKSRPSKRPRTSTTDEPRMTPSKIFKLSYRGNSDSNSGVGYGDHQTTHLPPHVHNRRMLHWYDADWERDNTYVPISLTKGRYDSELMLYRPMRPWTWLEKELKKLLTKEAHWKEVRAKRTTSVPILIVPNSQKGSKAQEGLKSMIAAALQRRRMHSSWTKDEPPQTSLKNPFVKKPTWAPPLAGQNAGPQPCSSNQQLLKPISTLQIPEFTDELLQRNAGEGFISQDLMAKSESTELPKSRKAKNSLATAKTLSWAPLTTSTDLGEEGPKRRDIRVSDPIPTASSSMMSDSVRSDGVSGGPKKKSGGKREKTRQPGFDWTAWASKKS